MKTLQTLASLLVGACLCGAVASCTAADAGPPEGPPPNGNGRPPGPPPEAIAACNGKAEGTQASFTGRRGETVSGICQKIGQALAVRPAGMPPPASAPAR